MKTLFFIVLTFLLGAITVQAQQANNWIFGNKVRLDFNNGAPIASTVPGFNAWEGCSSISNTNGNLLFYTDGGKVWNRNYSVMPNGNGLCGGYQSSTQSSLIVPAPNSNEIYYIFTTDAWAGYYGTCGCLAYSIIDMSQNSSLGDVVLKNDTLFSPVAERLTGIINQSNGNVWVVSHEWNTNNYISYEITPAGLDTIPIISSVGAVDSGTVSNNSAAIGYMKFSPSGSKLARATNSGLILEICDFDLLTGIVSNPLTIELPSSNIDPPSGQYPYGVEFSPDGSKLYFSSGNARKIFQFDLNAGTLPDIVASKTIIASLLPDVTDVFPNALQIAPDNKIYVAMYKYPGGYDYIGRIEFPDLMGTSCLFNDSAVYLGTTYCNFGLPNFIQSYFSNSVSTIANFEPDIIPIIIFPNPTNQNATLTFDNPTKSNFSLTLFDNKGSLVRTITNITTDKVVIDKQDLSSGLYVFRLKSDKQTATGKLTIE